MAEIEERDDRTEWREIVIACLEVLSGMKGNESFDHGTFEALQVMNLTGAHPASLARSLELGYISQAEAEALGRFGDMVSAYEALGGAIQRIETWNHVCDFEALRANAESCLLLLQNGSARG